jgi:hypothetical protein
LTISTYILTFADVSGLVISVRERSDEECGIGTAVNRQVLVLKHRPTEEQVTLFSNKSSESVSYSWLECRWHAGIAITARRDHMKNARMNLLMKVRLSVDIQFQVYFQATPTKLEQIPTDTLISMYQIVKRSDENFSTVLIFDDESCCLINGK